MQIYLPPPTNHQDFQLLAEDVASVRYKPATVMGYGRSGQAQHGVDVYAEDHSGDKVGIQCKESKDDLTEREITDEADKAKHFPEKLDVFIVMTTARRDAKLQTKVIALNGSSSYSFTIRVEFWDDLVTDINRYAKVLDSYYDSFHRAFIKSSESAHLACLSMAFNRPAFKDCYLYERSHDDFEEALVGTKRLFRTGFLMDRWERIPIVQTCPVDSLPPGDYRDFVSSIEALLEPIYQTYIRDKNKGNQDSQEKARRYDDLRRRLLVVLNKKLAASGLPKIEAHYL